MTPPLALVTGAARGRGAAVARALVDAGFSVALADIDEAAARAAAAPLGTFALPLDVGDELAWITAMATLLDRSGGLALLVNHGAIGDGGDDPERTSLADWRSAERVALEGVFLGCKHALPALRRRGSGAIANLLPATRSWARAAVAAQTTRLQRHCLSAAPGVRCAAFEADAGAAVAAWALSAGSAERR